MNTKIREQINQAVCSLIENEGLYRLLSFKNDFPDIFHEMKAHSPIPNPDSTPSTPTPNKNLKIGKNVFPYFTNPFKIKFINAQFYLKDGTPILPLEARENIKFTNSVTEPFEVIDDNWNLVLKFNFVHYVLRTKCIISWNNTICKSILIIFKIAV